MAKGNTIQVSGFGTISRSNTFAQAMRDSIMGGTESDQCPSETHQRAFSVTLYDREGNEVKVSGTLYQNQKNSLTSRVAFKLPLSAEDLTWVEKKEKGEKAKKASAEELASELLGS